ncbi:MAG: hypothetical protein IPG86_12985 [Chitinophagaceae bacterium]|nr:hypothetical protein [Chitinophagaceae bacterium]
MLKRWSILPALFLLVVAANAQNNPSDTAVRPVPLTDLSLIDTSMDYDEFFRDFDEFMDSILSPRSYFLASISGGKGLL